MDNNKDDQYPYKMDLKTHKQIKLMQNTQHYIDKHSENHSKLTIPI
jgi:hypothetical protein